jgi:hypothetical protein
MRGCSPSPRRITVVPLVSRREAASLPVPHQHQRTTAAYRPAHRCSFQTAPPGSVHAFRRASEQGRQPGQRSSVHERDRIGSATGCAARSA